ncbi:hypothetical protein A1O3_09963 [Capronia epimyces CBS 606.96]|uniref:Dynein light chain, cytosolic n=1 Tax=Capronia epimyces CBS 606.96 TaxID=1182542 RepID=W9Y5K4_9EURO|nr:uncharacterized protein A1O3_09963 [Capronia epimyces CBS 606.96]EXJ77734.1 hypothetical protein A1O3_09963 [Capronia epimyces CBS 606.96]
MSTLLRKVKSTINATALDPPSSRNADTLATRSRPQKVPSEWRPETFLDPSLVSNNPARQSQPEHPHALTQFRRRLSRKASTFSLRTKRWKAELRERRQEGKKGEESNLAQRFQDDSVQPEETHDKASVNQVADRDRRSFIVPDTKSHPAASAPVSQTQGEDATPITVTEASSLPQFLQDFIRKTQEGYICLDQEGGKISAKMASEHTSAPPVPYTRLKEITESTYQACEAALAGVQAYSHPDTESWNTTIINSILGALVEETTQKATASGSGTGQPQFKYVVNSTIIQHAAAPSSSSDDTKKTSGRRGMHAASGAYWNNEKDGMWSYKYPGADSKGLDVVVGIIWVWVG